MSNVRERWLTKSICHWLDCTGSRFKSSHAWVPVSWRPPPLFSDLICEHSWDLLSVCLVFSWSVYPSRTVWLLNGKRLQNGKQKLIQLFPWETNCICPMGVETVNCLLTDAWIVFFALSDSIQLVQICRRYKNFEQIHKCIFLLFSLSLGAWECLGFPCRLVRSAFNAERLHLEK